MTAAYLVYVRISALKSLATIVNRILDLVDLELRQRGQTVASLTSYPQRPSAGKIIEFIGTRGIGKSTLNNDLHKVLKKNWFFRADLGQIGPSLSSSDEIERLHRDIYFHKIRRLKKTKADPWESITTSRQMSKVIAESLTILTNTFPRGFILDESLFKNFPREVLKLGSESPSPLWRNRAFIYLRARDPDFVVSRYQSRVLERSSRGLLQRPPSDQEVREWVARDNNLFDRMLEKAHSFGCPAVVVNPENNHQDNIKKILQFESELHTNCV